MTSRASKVFVAAVLASSIPAAALAHERECQRGDGDDDHRPVYYAPPAEYAPPADYAPAPVYAPAPEVPVAPPFAPYWREGAWRGHRIRELRAELRALEARRAEAYARFGWNPRRTWRFERWYGARRAELERRLYELRPVAWR